MILKDTLKYKINQATLLLVAFVLPLHKALIAPMIVFLFITSLINIKSKASFKNISFIRHFSISSVFLFLLIGLSWTQNMQWAGKDIEIKFSLIAFPIILYLANLKWSQVVPKVLMAFIEGTILSSTLLLAMSLYYYIGTQDTRQFYYTKLSILHHPSYMAMYICFSITLIYLFSFSPKRTTYIKPFWALFMLTFLSLFTLLLASKTGLICILLIHFFALLYWIIKHKKIKYGIISLGVIISITTAGYLNSTFIQTRVNELFTSNSQLPANSSTNVRVFAWKIAKKVIYDAPILGAGTGDAKDILDEKYLEQGQFKLVEKSLNAHNQFLQITIQLGIVGLVLFVMTIIVPALLLLKHKYTPPLFLALILLLNGMTEAWLETQSGVVFFAFFLSIFWSYYQEIKLNKLNTKK